MSTARFSKKDCLSWLAEWRDEAVSGENKYNVYNRARNSLQATQFPGGSGRDVMIRIDDLRGVKYIGEIIRKKVEDRVNHGNGATDAQPSKAKGKGKKRAADVEGPTGSSPPKRAKATGAAALRRSNTTVASTSAPDGATASSLTRTYSQPSASTIYNPDMTSAVPEFDWVALGLTPEEIAYNVRGGLQDPRAHAAASTSTASLHTPVPSVPVAPVPAAKPKAKAKAKAAATAPRQSQPLPPPPVFNEEDTSLVIPTQSTSTASPLTVPALTTLHACNYAVTLLLDNREVKDQKHRTHIADALRKRNVPVLSVALSIGDVMFAARRLSDHKLFVLDVILERKRLDDLVGSIKDGRFHEQKFRLANSGVSHVFYLVEEYNPAKFAGFFEPAINTSLSQTIVTDAFEVQETRNLAFTIDYYANLYDSVVDMYKDKPIYILPPQSLTRTSYPKVLSLTRKRNPEMCRSEQYAIDYDSFQSLNAKAAQGTITLGECWAKMLLCVKGLSAEKIAAVTGINDAVSSNAPTYGTPRKMWESFMRDIAREQAETTAAAREETGHATEKKKARKKKIRPARELLCEIDGSSGRAKVGPVLSGHLYDLLIQSTYD